MDPFNQAQGAQHASETANSAAAETHGNSVASEVEGATGSHAPTEVAPPRPQASRR